LWPLRPELDAKTKTCLAEGELSSRLDEQAICEKVWQWCENCLPSSVYRRQFARFTHQWFCEIVIVVVVRDSLPDIAPGILLHLYCASAVEKKMKVYQLLKTCNSSDFQMLTKNCFSRRTCLKKCCCCYWFPDASTVNCVSWRYVVISVHIKIVSWSNFLRPLEIIGRVACL
jgi:hypothetical protein